MTQDLAKPENNDDREGGLSWPRIAGISFALALHAAALLLLLAPISPPAQEADEEDVVNVTFIEPPPPPPPPPHTLTVMLVTPAGTVNVSEPCVLNAWPRCDRPPTE